MRTSMHVPAALAHHKLGRVLTVNWHCYNTRSDWEQLVWTCVRYKAQSKSVMTPCQLLQWALSAYRDIELLISYSYNYYSFPIMKYIVCFLLIQRKCYNITNTPPHGDTDNIVVTLHTLTLVYCVHTKGKQQLTCD